MGMTTKTEIIELIDSLTADREVVVTTGVGSHQQLVARHFTWDYPKRQLLSSAGHGTMGFGVPAAIGAALANPDALVICFNGDGSMNFDINHLPTIKEYGLNNITIIVLDDNSMGIVRQFEDLSGYEHVATADRPNPDFAAIAKASGLFGFDMRDYAVDRVSQWEILLNGGNAALVHCAVDDYAVWPILEGGKVEMTNES